ncbi:hypothetical protein CSB09_01930 [Candidatus Gracilibacteria bacterium]|nr:MAG: hypothetical protein CSB09_01930 [Candidatus Gracilibacteria bacterium]
MKKFLLFLILTLGLSQTVGAIPGPNQACEDSVKLHNEYNQKIHRNFYYGNTDVVPNIESGDRFYGSSWWGVGVVYIYNNHKFDKCLYSKKGTNYWEHINDKYLSEDIQLESVIPVYVPREKYPRGYYFVWIDTTQKKTSKKYIVNARVISNSDQSYSPIRFFPWFDGGRSAVWPHYQNDSKYRIYKGNKPAPYSMWIKNMRAYLKSQTPEFANAPQLQMYWYLNTPLLVARDETGKVYKVFFQRDNVKNPIETAKSYLGDEWYTPAK